MTVQLDEIYAVPRPGRAAALARRARAATRGLARAWRRTGVAGSAPGSSALTPGAGPVFPVTGFEASFDQLEAILFHPAILAAVEAPPAAPFVEAIPPSPRLPRGWERFARGPRARSAPIVDIVPMSLELDVLELRLMQLYDLVDRFVVTEAPRSYGGARKPLFLERNAARFARFAPKLLRVTLPDDAIGSVYAERVRKASGYAGDRAMHVAMWKAVREHVDLPAGAICISSDLDELPSRELVQLLRERDVELPLRVRTPALRYRFGVSDPETATDIVIFSKSEFPRMDGDGMLLRDLPAPAVRARGSVHLTSFLDPLALIAKFVMTTDWDEGIVPFIRNEHDESAAMMARPAWFSRRLPAYDAERDPEGLVPWYARVNRARYARFWKLG